MLLSFPAKYGEGKRSNVFGTYEVGVKANNGFIIQSAGAEQGFSDTDLISLTIH